MTEVRTPSNDFVPGSWIIFMSYTESKQKSKREECENESTGIISYKTVSAVLSDDRKECDAEKTNFL